jgi:hypothetical protein
MRGVFLKIAGAMLGITLAFSAQALEKFDSEVQAQQHCPKDTVVWLNLPTMIWHTKGERWYGLTKNGAYVCRGEAAAESARGSKNAQ